MQNYYRPDIDGLRAVAVGLVVLHHCGLMFSGGFVGVDVFFVISGYLITRLIVADLDAGKFSFRGFWLRRIRRIAPAAAATVAATLLVGYILLLPREFVSLSESAIYQQFALSNMYFWSHVGYFDLPAEQKPLLHTWSLAVEEQFYLLYPFLLAPIYRRSKRIALVVIVVTGIASLASSEAAVLINPSFAFYFMPVRMWELLLGALLVFFPGDLTNRPNSKQVLGFLGLLLIFSSASLDTSQTPFPGFRALPATLGSVLIIAAVSNRLISATSILSSRYIVDYVGKPSYSIYLWHWPILVYAKIIFLNEFSLGMRVCVAASSVVAGIASYKLIEKPVRDGRVAKSSAEILTLFGLSIATVVICCNLLNTYMTSEYGQDVATQNVFVTSNDSQINPITDTPPTESRVIVGEVTDKDQDPSFLLWGDSHAGALFQLCDSLARKHHIYGVSLTRGGFVPLVGAWSTNSKIVGKEDQLKWNHQVFEWIAKHNIKHVIVACLWEGKTSSCAVDSGLETLGMIRDNESQVATREEAGKLLDRLFVDTARTFKAMGVQVWFVQQIPTQNINTYGIITGPSAKGTSRIEYEKTQTEICRVLKSVQSPLFKVIGPSDRWFDSDGFSLKTDGKSSYYRDGMHLNTLGAEKQFGPLLEPVFDIIAKDQERRSSQATSAQLGTSPAPMPSSRQ